MSRGPSGTEGPFLPPKGDNFYKFEKRIREELVPKIERSGMTISLVTDAPTDVKFAVELGLSIMLDKPIIAVVTPGAHVSAKLREIAEEVIEVDLLRDPENASRIVGETMERVATKYNL